MAERIKINISKLKENSSSKDKLKLADKKLEEEQKTTRKIKEDTPKF